MPKTVNCPTCQRPVRWEPTSIWRPFCSERCKLIDLGDWFDESHCISEPLRDDAGGLYGTEFDLGSDPERGFDEEPDQEFRIDPEAVWSSGGPSKH